MAALRTAVGRRAAGWHHDDPDPAHLELTLLLDRLLPAHVGVAEAWNDEAPAELYQGEAEAVARAVESRRREFATGRRCAREALARIGHPAVAIPVGENREPLWPADVVGSITHCEGYRAAAVARVGALLSVGVDAEPDAPLPDGVLEHITFGPEREHLHTLARLDPTVNWDRLVFAAKESVYKAWFPLARRWLGFDEARVTIDPQARTFVAALLVPGPALANGPLQTLRGRWLSAEGLLLTAVVVGDA